MKLIKKNIYVPTIDWGSIATISCRDPILGKPFSNVMSFSDGITPETATGIPYMYFTNMEMSVEDINCKNEMSLSMTLAQGDYCKQKGLDPQDRGQTARLIFRHLWPM